MRLLGKHKDGGPASPVDAYFLFEVKSIGSIAFLKFNKGSRKEFHTHAFNAFTWFLSGNLSEEDFDGSTYQYSRSIIPKVTKKNKNHKVHALKDSWCFTIRGPWESTWTEDNKETKTKTTFTNHRKVVDIIKGN